MTETMETTRSTFDWRAVILSGIVAGLVFLILELALVPLTGASVWAPVRMIAAIALGTEVLPPPASFELGIFMVAMIVHFGLSIVYAAILGLMVRDRSISVATMAGAAFGLVLFLINFYVFTGAFPWFAAARNWVSVVAHVAFGAVAGAMFVWVSGRVGATVPARSAA